MPICRMCSAEYEAAPSVARYREKICRPCKAARLRDWRRARAAARPARPRGPLAGMTSAERQRFYYQSDPERRFRTLVRSKTRYAIRTGLLTRQPCEVCGSVEVEAHHDDYNLPLEVRWLCPAHHRAIHRQIKLAA